MPAFRIAAPRPLWQTPPPPKDTADWWFQALERPGKEHLLRAMSNIGRISNWERLWIIQDLLRASNMSLLCGGGALHWTSFNAFCRELPCSRSDLNGTKFDIVRMLPKVLPLVTIMDGVATQSTSLHCPGYKVVEPFSAQKDQFRSISFNFSTRKCAKPRDKVFDILSLGDWPTGIAQIDIDYGVSSPDLTIATINCYRENEDFSLPDYVHEVASAVGIENDESPIMDLLTSRQKGYTNIAPEERFTRNQNLSTPVTISFAVTSSHILSESPSGHAVLLRGQNGHRTLFDIHQNMRSRRQPRPKALVISTKDQQMRMSVSRLRRLSLHYRRILLKQILATCLCNRDEMRFRHDVVKSHLRWPHKC